MDPLRYTRFELLLLLAPSGCIAIILLVSARGDIDVAALLVISVVGGLGLSFIVFFLRIFICDGRRKWRASDRRKHSQCESCGYLLYGLPQQRCPECGTPFSKRITVDRPPDP